MNRSYRRLMKRAGLAVLCGWLALAPAAGAQWLSDLFRLGEPRATLPIDEGVVASQRVEIDTWQLDREPELLTFVLPDGRRYQARRTRVERRGRLDLAWHGRLEPGGGPVILTLTGDDVSGLIYAPGATYQLEPRADGLWLETVEFGRLPECGVEPGPALALPRWTSGEESPGSESHTTRIDLLAVYTKKARKQQGGRNKIENKIQNAVDWANDAFGNSEMNVRFEVVRFEEVDLWDHGGGKDGSVQVLYGSNGGVSAVGLLRQSYRTVMSYNACNSGSCTRLPYFSKDRKSVV